MVSIQNVIPYNQTTGRMKYFNTHLNGVGSFLLRTLRGLLAFAGVMLDAYEYRPRFRMLSVRSPATDGSPFEVGGDDPGSARELRAYAGEDET